MGSSLDDEHILSALLQSDDELVGEDSDSEISDHVSEDDVQSDTEEAFIDEVHEVQPTSSGSEILDEQNVIEQPGSSLASNRILTLPQRTIRGKNKHCWSTSKSTRRSRVSALNIVRSEIGRPSFKIH